MSSMAVDDFVPTMTSPIARPAASPGCRKSVSQSVRGARFIRVSITSVSYSFYGKGNHHIAIRNRIIPLNLFISLVFSTQEYFTWIFLASIMVVGNWTQWKPMATWRSVQTKVGQDIHYLHYTQTHYKSQRKFLLFFVIAVFYPKFSHWNVFLGEVKVNVWSWNRISTLH